MALVQSGQLGLIGGTSAALNPDDDISGLNYSATPVRIQGGSMISSLDPAKRKCNQY